MLRHARFTRLMNDLLGDTPLNGAVVALVLVVLSADTVAVLSTGVRLGSVGSINVTVGMDGMDNDGKGDGDGLGLGGLLLPPPPPPPPTPLPVQVKLPETQADPKGQP